MACDKMLNRKDNMAPPYFDKIDKKDNPAAENKSYERVTEYKIGHTTYIVKTKFNFTGESLNELVSRLISKEINKSA